MAVIQNSVLNSDPELVKGVRSWGEKKNGNRVLTLADGYVS